jgi:hypothetical protein
MNKVNIQAHLSYARNLLYNREIPTKCQDLHPYFYQKNKDFFLNPDSKEFRLTIV